MAIVTGAYRENLTVAEQKSALARARRATRGPVLESCDHVRLAQVEDNPLVRAAGGLPVCGGIAINHVAAVVTRQCAALVLWCTEWPSLG